jgi:PIN domain nuclease of toxin-antitoxin system
MKFLIDTHILLWYLMGDKRINDDTIKIIENRNNLIFFSNASLWEITIKSSIGKLELTSNLINLYNFLIDKGFILLEFDVFDLETLHKLPFYHQDPFDRLIVSQAITKSLTMISNDNSVLRYLK